MPTDAQLQKFHEVYDSTDDPNMQQLIQIHGPFDSERVHEGNVFMSTVCLACNVPWDCLTFTLLRRILTGEE